MPLARLVLDTNTVISGLLWNGPPRRLLDAALDGAVELYTSAGKWRSCVRCWPIRGWPSV